MNIIDWIVGIVLILSGLWGYKKGLLRMVGGILAGTIALFSAFYLRNDIAKILYNIKPELPEGIYILLAFVLIFASVLTILSLIITFVYKVISLTPIVFVDRVLGSILSLLFTFAVIFAIFYASYQSGWKSKDLEESLSFKMFLQLSPDSIWNRDWKLKHYDNEKGEKKGKGKNQKSDTTKGLLVNTSVKVKI